MELDSFLAENDLFSSLSSEQRQTLAAHSSLIQLNSGDVLFNLGDQGGNVFLVSQGSLEVIKQGEKGFDVTLANKGVGSLVGTTSLFEQTHTRSATVRAKEPTQVWSLDQEWLRQTLASEGDFSLHFMAYLSQQLRQETHKRAELLSKQIDRSFKLFFFDAKKYERAAFDKLNHQGINIQYIEARLNLDSVSMSGAASAVCVFVNDRVDRPVLEKLSSYGVGLVALRCAGFNNVDLDAAKQLGISVTRVPAYSPYAVAEHALAMMMTLNRKIHRAYNRVKEGNFYLNRLVGFDMHGRTAGIIGTGKIGRCLISILKGMGMNVLVWDAYPDQEYAQKTGVTYVPLDDLLSQSDVISLHVPLLPETHHLIDSQAFNKMKPGAMLINTSRGGLVDTKALIKALKSEQLGCAGLDVYEEEENYFFSDHSGQIIDDDTLARLISFPNVLITSHQAFLTRDALENIANTTLESVQQYRNGKRQEELTYLVHTQ